MRIAERFDMQQILVEVILGYVVQCMACVLCVAGMAKRKLPMWQFLVSSIGFAVIAYVFRKFLAKNLNFGVHTIINMIILSGIGIVFLKLDIQPTILGSIFSMALIMGSELANVAFIVLLKQISFDEVSGFLASCGELQKTWYAVPGNIVIFLFTLAFYCLRIRAKKGEVNGKTGKAPV